MVSNGEYRTKSFGLVFRFVCRTCGNTWKEYEDQHDLLQNMRFHEAETDILRAFALLCIGLPLTQIEGLVGRKSETIHGWAKRCSRRPEVWQSVTQRLTSEFGVTTGQVESLTEALSGVPKGQATFHAYSRRQPSAYSRPQRRRKQEAAEKMALLRSDPGMAGLSEEENGLQLRRMQRHLEKPLPPPFSKKRQAGLERIRGQAERILGERIVFTLEGEFYRWDDDRRMAKWLTAIKRFDVAKGERLLELLFPMERLLFDQVRSPNEEAHVFAKLEGARGTRISDTWVEKMTPSCLADSLRFEPGYFIYLLKSLATFLRTPDTAH